MRIYCASEVDAILQRHADLDATERFQLAAFAFVCGVIAAGVLYVALVKP